MLKKIFQQLFGKEQERSSRQVAQQTVVRSLPELTNADLDYLFSQLLEGVGQARGQQWAIKFLQRMENRISEERWLVWLQNYGDRLLASPVPNDDLAFRLVQFGELEVGAVGDLAYEIGMQLLARNSGSDYWQDVSTEPMVGGIEIHVPVAGANEVESNSLLPPLPPLVQNSRLPEQDLFSNEYGEYFQEAENKESTQFGVVSNLDTTNLDTTNFETINFETAIVDIVNLDAITSFVPLETPGQDLIRVFGDELWDNSQQENVSHSLSTELPDTTDESNISSDEVGNIAEENVAEENVVFMTFDADIKDSVEDFYVLEEIYIENYPLDNTEDSPEENTESKTLSYDFINPVVLNSIDENFTAANYLEENYLEENTESTTTFNGEFINPVVIHPIDENIAGENHLEEDTTFTNFNNQVENELKNDVLEENTPEESLIHEFGEELWTTSPESIISESDIELEAELNQSLSSFISEDFVSDEADNIIVNLNSENIELGITDTSLQDSPGQQLLREFGESLWGLNSHSVEITEIGEEETQETQETQETTASTSLTGEEWARIIDANYVEFFVPETTISVPLQPSSIPEQEVVTNLDRTLDESLDYSSINELEITSETEEIGLVELESQTVINESFEIEITSAENVTESNPTENNIDNDFDAPIMPVTRQIFEPTTVGTNVIFDETLINVPSQIAVTLDELWVRLRQSANLVEQLASGLLNPANTQQLSIVDEPNKASTQAQAQAWYYQGLQQTKNEDLASAIASYDQAIALAPDAYEYWFNRGLALFHLGRLEDAIASYENAIAIKPDYYKAWFNRGAGLGELERFDGALASFDKAIELKSDYDEAWSGKALALLKLGQITAAISCYDKATQLEPQDTQAWYYRGVALSENKLYAEAISSFDEALEIQPQYHLAWFNRGLAQAQLEQWEDAIISYQKALKSQPGSYELWYLRGVALDKCQRHEDAIESYDNALALNPELYDIWIDKGVIYANLGQWQEAISAWDKALDIQPNLYIGWFNKAIAHEKLGQPKKAILAYDETVAIEPNFHVAWYNRGLLLFAIEKYEDAILSFDYTLQLQPDYLEAWMARANAVEKSPGFDFYLSSHSAIASANPSLTARGKDGKLATYAAAVNYIDQNTYPETWAKLYLTLGNAYYDRGKHHSFINDDWSQAIHAYNQALLTATPENFLELHLEVLQNITKVLIGFGDTNQAQQFQTYATTLLANALNQTNRDQESKKTLALKFASLGQMAVDIAVQKGELVEALEIAEYGKNVCLNWLISGSHQKISSPNYDAVQKLVNSTTAIVYWHISPSGLRSFIVKKNHPEPLLVFTPIFSIGEMDELPIPEAVERLTEFEDWLDDWQQEYNEYRHLGIENIEQNQDSWEYSWQRDMLHRLLKLREILNISAIEQELEGITKLILIPHRELFKLPLHALFQIDSPNLELTITYLPNVEIGLSQLNKSWQLEQQSLLSIEAPNTLGYKELKSTKLETEAITQMFINMKRIVGEKATKQEIESEIKNYNILHFTGYIADNTIHPQKSALLLAESDTLTLEEISDRTLANYNLITLSAGEIVSINQQNNQQIITSRYTSEYVEIITVLMKQGVNHIVSTQWMVEPGANALLMVEFYRKLKEGKSATIALNEATIWLKELTVGDLKKWYDILLRKSPLGGVRIQALVANQLSKTSNMAANEKLYSHPYYWAGFKISGNLD
jgi:tetratricopeptide (TPR) repeat protein/CHAT domain-containing protein